MLVRWSAAGFYCKYVASSGIRYCLNDIKSMNHSTMVSLSGTPRGKRSLWDLTYPFLSYQRFYDSSTRRATFRKTTSLLSKQTTILNKILSICADLCFSRVQYNREATPTRNFDLKPSVTATSTALRKYWWISLLKCQSRNSYKNLFRFVFVHAGGQSAIGSIATVSTVV